MAADTSDPFGAHLPPAAPPPTCRVVEGLRHIPIPRRLNLSLAEFRRLYSDTSRPVILAGAIKDWPASRLWSTEYISSLCGNRSLQQSCHDTKSLFLFRTQLKRFNRSLNGQTWAAMQEIDTGAEGMRTVDDLLRAQRERPDLYLHDQSINLFCPTLLDDVRAPRYFPVDFLRQVPSSDARQGRSDAASCAKSWHPSLFVGRAGSESGLHADSMATRFWMGVVRGSKWFRLVAPRDASQHLYPHDGPVADMGHYSAAFSVDLFRPNLRRHPRLREARVWEGNVSAGDLIFIPEMWARSQAGNARPGMAAARRHGLATGRCLHPGCPSRSGGAVEPRSLALRGEGAAARRAQGHRWRAARRDAQAHQVINTEDSLAVSYNFVDEASFEPHLQSQYHKMAAATRGRSRARAGGRRRASAPLRTPWAPCPGRRVRSRPALCGRGSGEAPRHRAWPRRRRPGRPGRRRRRVRRARRQHGRAAPGGLPAG